MRVAFCQLDRQKKGAPLAARRFTQLNTGRKVIREVSDVGSNS